MRIPPDGRVVRSTRGDPASGLSRHRSRSETVCSHLDISSSSVARFSGRSTVPRGIYVNDRSAEWTDPRGARREWQLRVASRRWAPCGGKLNLNGGNRPRLCQKSKCRRIRGYFDPYLIVDRGLQGILCGRILKTKIRYDFSHSLGHLRSFALA